MLTRRSALLGSALAVAAVPALAQPPRPVARSGKGKKDATPEATGSPATTPLGPVDTTARWAYIQDFNTGASLLEKQADDQMPPSSMTKLMTLYIVYERLASGRMKLDDQLPVSERAWRMGGSKMFVQIGTTVGVEDLIRGIVVDSGNDACIVLAEAISGSEEQFAELMNDTAKKLGLTNSHFMNATGWPADNHYMSSRDIVTLAGDIIRQFPQYYHYDSEKTFKYNNIEQGNRNPLVQKGTADGLKTGHTEAGGYGVVASTRRGDRRVVLVLNGMETMRERSEESERLMDWAFANFEDVTLFAAGDVVDQAPVWLGASPDVPLVSGHDLVVTMPRNWRRNAKVQISYAAPIHAPIAKGATVGKLTVAGDGVPSMEVPLLAGADVSKLSLPGRAMAVLSHYVTGS
ncbi:MAG: D-alanyl-D-alanine carboxypeptidase family protein [Acetobacteraceae bacterium]|jgi:D-alanyl-D-alanine carboxypeptidase (penicillin-binding protein 5/6)